MLFALATGWAAPTDTSFSEDRGFFDAPFDLEITTDDPAATIYYTLDRTDPTPASPVYTGPIPITGTTIVRAMASDGVVSTNIDTSTYLFPSDIPAQMEEAGMPSSWGGYGADYWMDPDILNHPVYGPQFEDSLRAVPSVSLVTENANLWDADTGIYLHPTQSGVDWERPVSMEWINTDGPDWQEDAGIRITGGYSRNPNATPKHSLRLLFKEQYGVTKLEQDVFETQGASEKFDTLVLRAGFNYSWMIFLDWERTRAQYLRDTWIADSQRAMGHPSPHMRYVHLYLNGLYWGLYKIQERPEASFASDYFGGDKDNWDAINSGEAIDGDTTAWNAMYTTAAQDQSDAANYAATLAMVDEQNLIDYMLLNFLSGNFDWDWHNFYAARERTPGATWKFFSWDAERSMDDLNRDMTGLLNPNKPTAVHQALTAQPEYRIKFADRVHKHMFNDGVLDCTTGAARYLERANEIELAMVSESARWGDYSRDVYPSGSYQDLQTVQDHWLPERDWMLNTYFPARCGIVLDQFRAAGLYPALDAPEFDQHGGRHPVGTPIALINPSGTGTVYLTTDGSDPRAVGGAIAPTAVPYTSAVPLTMATAIQARVWDGTSWSALLSADFTVEQPFDRIRINELHYNSPSISEFVELYNRGPEAVDLSGTVMGNGVQLAFPTGTVMPPDSYLVLSEDADDFFVDYGQNPDFVYEGRLSNKGERVSLEDRDGTVLVTVDYDDDAPWPTTPDGDGPSLELITPDLDPSDPANWQASWVDLGTPWEENSCQPFDWIDDLDADGFGDDATVVSACEAPPGSVPAAQGGDCDDADGEAYPGAPDICDGIDHDCDGTPETPTPYYADADTDGFGDPADSIIACSAQAGRVEDGTDCDDSTALSYPGAVEQCDGQDNNCDGDNDVFLASWTDTDGDGFGQPGTEISDCSIPPGNVDNGDDCDDAVATVFPNNPEICDGLDNNCDGATDEGIPTTAWFLDADADGFGGPTQVNNCAQPTGTSETGGDCNDTDAGVYPGAPEYCDGVDTNCNTMADDNPVDGFARFRDEDEDGYGDPDSPVNECVIPPLTADNSEDCDDTEPLAWTGAEERCDGVDNDCDGTVDGATATDARTWYEDLDNDGFGTPANETQACTAPPGFAETSDDCDDTNASTNPGAPEQCDSVDHDCEGTADNGVVDVEWYRDEDGDNYGLASDVITDCLQPAGYSLLPGDCDDTEATVNPGEAEVCDELDNDCDGIPDNNATGSVPFFTDNDGDGFGSDPVLLCALIPGFSVESGDCDDTNPSVNPFAVELCDGQDGNCDGEVDNNPVDAQLVFQDSDGDGYGNPNVFDGVCTVGAGWTLDNQDCDDSEPLAWTAESQEVCDGVDNNCDGWLDDADPDVDLSTAPTWFVDADNDGFGSSSVSAESCGQPDGYVNNADDCLDTNATVFPGGVEIPNDGLDQDCDGEDAVEAPDPEPVDPMPPEEPPEDQAGEPAKGCGCNTGGAPMGWVLLAATALARTRRRTV